MSTAPHPTQRSSGESGFRHVLIIAQPLLRRELLTWLRASVSSSFSIRPLYLDKVPLFRATVPVGHLVSPSLPEPPVLARVVCQQCANSAVPDKPARSEVNELSVAFYESRRDQHWEELRSSQQNGPFQTASHALSQLSYGPVLSGLLLVNNRCSLA